MDQKRQRILVVVILLGVAILSAAFFVFSRESRTTQNDHDQTSQQNNTQTHTDNSSIDTSKWKIYKNEKYGFEMMYPENWQMRERSGDNADRSVVSFISPDTMQGIREKRLSNTCDWSIYYYPSIMDEPENKMNNFGATTIQEMIDRDDLIKSIGIRDLGGENATEVVWGGAGASYTLLSDHANHLFMISSCNKDDPQMLTKTDRAILESFKFTK